MTPLSDIEPNPSERKTGSADDLDLMARFQRGDIAAFEQLYSRHKKPIYNFCLRMVGERELAADAMQEIFTKVIDSAASFSPRARFTTWLYTIARNYCHDLARRRGTRGATLAKLGSDSIASAPDRAIVEGAQPDPPLRRILADAIGALPDDQREVFLLRATSDLSFDEIAEVTAAPANTVKSRMRLAVARLKVELSRAGITGEVAP